MVSTLQLSIYKMDCLISGASKVSLSSFENCNGENKNDCAITEACCCFHQIALDFDYTSSLIDVNIDLESFISLNFQIAISNPIVEPIEIISFSSLPPPSGYDLLKLVQVFRL
jgi:hypothetical protein